MRSPVIRWLAWVVALVVCCAGLWMSWYLRVNETKWPPQPTSQKAAKSADKSNDLLGQACGAFTWADCDVVAASPWAVFPFGATKNFVYVATGGLVFFTGMICWLLMVGWPTPSRSWVQTLPLVATGFGIGLSIFLEVIMWTKLPKSCVLCIGTHVSTLILFVLLLIMWPRERRTPATTGVAAVAAPWPAWWTLTATPVVMLAAIIVVVGLAQMVAVAKSGLGGGKKADLELLQKGYAKMLSRYETKPEHAYMAWELAPRMQIPTAGRPSKGPADARHTIVIFSDFECPHCQDFAERFDKKIAPAAAGAETGGVRLVFKHWPLSAKCNLYSREMHPVACEAAYAAEAAFVLGGDAAFWKMHDLLFEKKDEWTESKDFAGLAQTIGLDKQAFMTAMNSEQVRKRIKADVEDGATLGAELISKGAMKVEDREWYAVTSTPTVYVDGKQLHVHNLESVWWRILTAPPAAESGPAGTQPADLGARVAKLELQLKKAKDEMAALNGTWARLYNRYDSRPEHVFLAWQLTPAVNIAIEGRPALGPQDAKHTVVIFDDLQWLPSKMFDREFKKAILPTGKSPTVGGIRVIFKHWPMATECNPNAKGNAAMKATCKAAYAAEAAYALGGDEMFWKMHDLLFEKQDEWKKTLDFSPLAAQIGLDEKKFLEAMNSKEIRDRVKADIEEGDNLGKDLVAQGAIKEDQREWIKVGSVPSIFVDGKRLYSLQHVSAWNSILGYVPKAKTTASRPAAK